MVVLVALTREYGRRPPNPANVMNPHTPGRRRGRWRPPRHAEKELEPLPGFRWHDFRHFAVSVLIVQKADILTLARIAGHSEPDVTLRIYGHLMQGPLADAAEKYDPLREAFEASR